ncbi:MAG: aldo/keto reductase [Rhodospirillales bacterium]|nr:aldo/keto reductase [Rhodospirillales bacterium]
MTIPPIALPNGIQVPTLGQGSWYMGEDAAAAQAEIAALQTGIDLGMTLIDTAEMYADGGAEEVVGHAIAGRRDKLFLVSKVYPHNASAKGVPQACARSLKRLKTDRIDLYLLHWRGAYPLAETVEAFERLREAGHIGAWGVSNFDTSDMQELATLPAGGRCVANQVLYNPEARGIEFDLLPWCKAGGVPVMAYSPLGQAGRLLKSLALLEISKRHGVSPAQVALAWSLRGGNTIAIPKASSIAHVRQNAAAANIKLTDLDLAAIDAAFSPPRRKQPLAML